MNSGMSAQQQWSGPQREATNPAAMHPQPSFGAQLPGRPASSSMNYSANFTNPTSQQQPAPDLNPMQSRPAGISQMPTPQPEAPLMEGILKCLQMHNIEPRIVIAGRNIEVLELLQAVKKFDSMPNHPVRTLSPHGCRQSLTLLSARRITLQSSV